MKSFVYVESTLYVAKAKGQGIHAHCPAHCPADNPDFPGSQAFCSLMQELKKMVIRLDARGVWITEKESQPAPYAIVMDKRADLILLIYFLHLLFL